MGDEGAAENVKQKNGKKVKPKSKKVITSLESATGIQEADNVDKMKVVGSALISEKEDNADMKRDHKRGQEKKNNKGTRDVERDIKTGLKEELTDADGEHGSKHTTDSAERRRKKKREKNKNKNDEFGDNTEDVKMNANKKCLEGGSVSEKESGKKVEKERKKQRVKTNNEDVDKVKLVGSALISEKEDTSDMKEDHKRGQEKKNNKGTRDVEGDIKTGLKEESTDADGEHGSKHTMDSAERRKKKRKREKNKNKNDEFGDSTEDVKTNENKKCLAGESVSGKESGKKVEKDRKKQRVKTNNEDVDIQEGEKDGEVIGAHNEDSIIMAIEMVERKKKKKDKKKNKDDDFIGPQDTYIEAKHNDGDLSSLHQKKPENVGLDVQSTMNDGNAMKEPERKKNKKHKKKENYNDDSSAPQQNLVDNGDSCLAHTEKIQNDEGKRKKKKTKLSENDSHSKQDNEDEYANKGKKRKSKIVENGSSDATPNKSNKKVRFSGEVEVFPLPGDSNAEEENDEDNLVRGKRFTSEEDEIVKDAVLKYIEEYELGSEGLNMVLNCSKYPKLKGCWKEIGSAIPYRPYNAIYFRARVLFMRSETRKWTQEEYDMILKHHEEHGSQWRALADELGKHAWHVKDTYRRIKLRDLKKGNWSQEEYQKLFDLVNTDLQLKVSEEKRSKHGMLRDNICWSAISDELSTRNQATCCSKWYRQLTSPMVAEGVWADSDDYRLLTALYDLDATCLEDVDWDDLVENRSGDVCRKRWNQMVLHIGHNGKKSFAEQVEILAQRYCPHLLEAREAWDSKPRVP